MHFKTTILDDHMLTYQYILPWFLVLSSYHPSKHVTLTNAGPMLAHRLQRWPSIHPPLGQRL